MEIELKYSIGDERQAEVLLRDSLLEKYRAGEEETIPMHALYFDTEDRALRSREIAFRLRQEGDEFIATLKWGGGAVEGMHRREEINLLLQGCGAMPEPNLSLFNGTEAESMLAELTRGKNLVPVMEIDFLRKQCRLDTGRAVCEISVDDGQVRCGEREERILELEIELYTGEEEEILRIGNGLAEKYSLKPCSISKFERGLGLLQEN